MRRAHHMVGRFYLGLLLAVLTSFLLVMGLVRYGMGLEARSQSPAEFYPALIQTSNTLAQAVQGEELEGLLPRQAELRALMGTEVMLVRELPDDVSIFPGAEPGMVLFQPGGIFYVCAPVEGGFAVSLAMRAPQVPGSVGLLMLLAIAVVVSGVSYLLAVPLLRRLAGLEEVAVRISDGDLSARADVGGGDAITTLAERFNLMAARVQELIMEHQSLLRAVAHEVRTPITRIRFGVEMLGLASTDEDRDRQARDLTTDLDELDALVTELTELSRLSSGARELNPGSRELRPVLERIVGRLSVPVTLDLSDGVEVFADPRSLDRALRNLLLNASRYCDTEVMVRAREGESGVEISVEDDGPGVPESERERVFEAFVRLDESRDRGTGGVGLGLALVERIMHLHGGRAEVDQSPQLGGARFTLLWPGPGETAPRGGA